MESFMQWLSQPQALLLCVAILLLLLVVPLYLRILRQRRDIADQNRFFEAMLHDNLQALASASRAERMTEREEMALNVRGMSDSLVQIVSEVSRIQQQQLDSFGTQIRTANQMDEQRMERMRQSIEERLQAYDRQMTRVTQTLDEKLAVNERRLNEMRQTLDGSMQRLQSENEKKLEQIRVTVDEKLNETLDKRLGESFRTVSEQLEQVYKGLGEMQTLATGVGDLKRMLTNVRTRGVWGEVQLSALLEQVLTPDQYDVNVAVKPDSSERVEFAIRLPGREDDGLPVYLPIDAKFPAEDYQRLLDATEVGDKAAVEAATHALEMAIRTEARRIQTKYIAPPYTTDFAIMFLPLEGLFAEVLRMRGIVERLQNDHRVVVTGPTTLQALLNSLQMGFRTLAIEKRSSEVWTLLGVVKAEFGKFAQILIKTQQKLQQASHSIEEATRKTRTIERKLKNVQELSATSAPPLLDLEDEVEQMTFGASQEEEDSHDL